jgi:hypothetical protein
MRKGGNSDWTNPPLIGMERHAIATGGPGRL